MPFAVYDRCLKHSSLPPLQEYLEKGGAVWKRQSRTNVIESAWQHEVLERLKARSCVLQEAHLCSGKVDEEALLPPTAPQFPP